MFPLESVGTVDTRDRASRSRRMKAKAQLAASPTAADVVMIDDIPPASPKVRFDEVSSGSNSTSEYQESEQGTS